MSSAKLQLQTADEMRIILATGNIWHSLFLAYPSILVLFKELRRICIHNDSLNDPTCTTKIIEETRKQISCFLCMRLLQYRKEKKMSTWARNVSVIRCVKKKKSFCFLFLVVIQQHIVIQSAASVIFFNPVIMKWCMSLRLSL